MVPMVGRSFFAAKISKNKKFDVDNASKRGNQNSKKTPARKQI